MTAPPPRTLARLPRGFADRGPGELASTRAMVETIRETFELWGFEAVETPFLEYTDALGKFLPDQDRPNAGVFSLQDDDEQWVSLRYDLTAPLARYVAENWDSLPKPYRSYRFGPVFRNEKPGPGRFRQFLQFDADTVGAPSVAADAEMCMMAADALEALGIPRGSYVIKVNNRKVLDGVMEAIGLGEEENAGRRLTVLRAIDKLDRLGVDGVKQLLGEGRKDESGDFTKGAGLTGRQIEGISRYIEWRANIQISTTTEAGTRIEYASGMILEGGNIRAKPPHKNQDVVDALNEWFGDSELARQGLRELKQIADIVSDSGYDDRILIDPSVVRGLEYYTGPVYEAELTFEITDEDGKPIRFGSVGGGGRYDGLVSRFRGEPVPATGFSIGVSRLQAALKLLGHGASDPAGPVVVLAFPKDPIEASMKLAKRLREARIAAEVYLGGAGMKPQLRYADKRRSPCVVIQGSNEREAGQVTVKDLIVGARAAETIADRAGWIEERPGQETVPEDQLVPKVLEYLARHGLAPRAE
jgi:histidyl-tRNA synthetase